MEKARQDVAGHWSLHVGSSWWLQIPDFCESVALVAPQEQRGVSSKSHPARQPLPGPQRARQEKRGKPSPDGLTLPRCFPEILIRGKKQNSRAPYAKMSVAIEPLENPSTRGHSDQI